MALNPEDFEVIGDKLIKLDKISSVAIVELDDGYELRLEGIVEKLTTVVTYFEFDKLVNDVVNAGMFPNKDAVIHFIKETTEIRNNLLKRNKKEKTNKLNYPTDPVERDRSIGIIVAYLLKSELNHFIESPSPNHIFVDAVMAGDFYSLDNKYRNIYYLTKSILNNPDRIDEFSGDLRILVTSMDEDDLFE